MPLTTLQKQCYDLLATLPEGYVTTYKDLAHAIGSKAYRAIGSAMKHNPYAPAIPCHRVVAHNGTIGGYAYGVDKKIDLLKKEGIAIKDNKILNFESKKYTFPS